MTGKKYEPPLYLDIDFAKALERVGTTDKKEVYELIGRAKKKRPPGPDTPTAKPHQTATPSGRSKRRKPDG
jgi:hypothetical protein